MTQAVGKARGEAAQAFARNAARLSFKDLPCDVVDMTKKGILDTLGVGLAASGMMPEIKTLAEIITEAGGTKESTILGFGNKVPAWHAGYINGAMSHCLDYDDMHAGASHIHAPVVPAAMAMAERQSGVSGSDFIAAVTLGVDLLCRFSLAGRKAPRGGEWYMPVVGGVFASALACGKLLALDEGRLGHALGIAFTQAAGTMEVVYSQDSNIRGLAYCLPGEAGVRSALMARREITGVKNIFDGASGLMATYFGGVYDRDILVGELDTRFPVRENGFKAWPSCAMAHIYIDATLSLVKEHNIRPDDIAGITVWVGDFAQKLCEPSRKRPSTTMNAKWSIPFTVALAAVRREVVIGGFTDDALKDEDVLRIAQLVESRVHPDYDRKPGILNPPGKVEIKTRNGKTFSRREEVQYGSPGKPMSWEDLIEKFRDCAGHSAKPISPRRVDKVIDMLTHLEDVADVSAVMRLLGGGRVKVPV